MNTGNSLYISRNHSDSLGSKKKFGSGTHWEPTRSSAANAYVWKDETAVPGTRFELGKKPLNRGDSKGGTRSRHWQNVENWMISLVTYTLEITCHSRESCQTAWNQLQSNGQFTVFGEQLVLENLDEHGQRLDWTLTQRSSDKILGRIS